MANMPPPRVQLGIFAMLAVVLLAGTVTATNTTSTSGIQWVAYTEPDGQTVWLRDDRKPALYTGEYGDCAGGSLINVSRFDAAYYADNMTVLFHLGGSTALTNESLMLYIGVYAYGELRFNLTFNPCNANINSLCPLNTSVPIEASGIIPVDSSNVADIPAIALTIPDFEGQAIMRVFANSTESQIACFSAVVTNGSSFSHPSSVGSVLGFFAAVALVASVAVTVYGQRVPETRKHYAHSISVSVVFSVFHHIYFTGALSVNWPSVLVAFWNNFAWSAGMIYNSSIQSAIVKFLGGDLGNITTVGSEPTGEDAVGLGGGFVISQIYKRDVPQPTGVPLPPHHGTMSALRTSGFNHGLASRELANASTGFSWYGNYVKPGLPLPGNCSGFPGTLAGQNIPAATAFMTGLIWFLILLGLIGFSMVLLKWILECLSAAGLLRTQKLKFFRKHWLGFTAAALLRTCFIAFFMMIYLSLFQFAFTGPSGVIAVAGVTFSLFFSGLIGAAAYAIFYRLRSERFKSEPDRLNLEQKKFGFFPWYVLTRESKFKQTDQGKKSRRSLPWWRIHLTQDHDHRLHVHDDEGYIRRFGWLSSRFRRSKWWFFSFWLVYEFVRACFYGAAAARPLTQIFGLLVVELLALIILVSTRPFESSRLNIIMVYLLGFSKVATIALSAAFVEQFNQPRILTTVIGIVIIVIQGLLAVGLLIAIVLGAISSYMSIMRNREEIKPKSWIPLRERYFKHIDQRATDQPPPPPPPPPSNLPQIPPQPYFLVSAVRRQPKIEDEDPDNKNLEIEQRKSFEQTTIEFDKDRPVSRSQSMRSRTSASHLPYGARLHRTSWSTRDFQDHFDGQEGNWSRPHSRMSLESIQDAPSRHRSSSLRMSDKSALPVAGRPDGMAGTSTNDPVIKRSASATYPQRPRLPRQATTVNEENETPEEGIAPNATNGEVS